MKDPAEALFYRLKDFYAYHDFKELGLELKLSEDFLEKIISSNCLPNEEKERLRILVDLVTIAEVLKYMPTINAFVNSLDKEEYEYLTEKL